MPAFTLQARPDGVAVLTFDLPGQKVNKLTTPVLHELDGLLDRIAADRQVRAMVVASGKPGSFIAGADIAEIRNIADAAQGEAFSLRGQQVMDKIEALPFPTAAAVHGPCLGGGFELALACSCRAVSSDPATVLGLPEVKLGIIPGFGGTQRLPRLAGLSKALEMIVTGRSVDAATALRMGIADAVARHEDLQNAAIRLAKESIGKPRPSGIRAGRPLIVAVLERIPLARSLIFRTVHARVLAETRGNYPAPLAAFEPVRVGLSEGRRAGYASEARTFGRLAASPVAKNLINVFFLKESLKKDGAPSAFTVARAGVIGSGVMAGVISRLFAEQGIAVTRKDAGTMADRSGFADVDIVVDASEGSSEARKSILKEFERIGKNSAIYASSTSLPSLSELQSASARPGRIVGLHFPDPAETMPLAEVIRGRRTAPETVAAVVALCRRLGRLPVVVNDGPGSLVDRILMPYLGEALCMLEEGNAVEDIDRALLAFGMPVGPFVLLDEIGIDAAHTASGVVRRVRVERAQPPALLDALCKEGYFGRKNGRGFYRYRRGKRGGANPRVAAMALKPGTAANRLAEQEIVERAVLLMVREAALCLEEGIIGRPDLLDAALIVGIGFPPFRGGLLRYAESLGAKHVVERLEALAVKHGERFAPPESLREMSRDDLIGQIVR